MKSFRVLVVGASGMLGNTLFRNLPHHGFDVAGTVRGAPWSTEGRFFPKVNVENLSQLDSVFKEFQPNAVVNCVGVIRQLAEGNDPLSCISMNSLFPHQLALLAEKFNSRVVHISTDCVFSGHKGSAYLENDFADAPDIYGRSKFLGELTKAPHITLRTSIVGHELRNKLSLIEWFLKQEGKVKGYRKAIYSGLPTVELTRVIAEKVLPNERLNGLYHVSSEPISKFELLNIVKKVYGKKNEIEPDDRVTENKSLDSNRFRKEAGYQPPKWEEMIQAMHKDFQGATNVFR